MGVARILQITDLGRLNADLGIECRACGRLAVFEIWDVAEYFRSRKLPTVWPPSVRPFRCRCGARDVRAITVARAERPNPMPGRPPVLQPMYIVEAKDRKR